MLQTVWHCKQLQGTFPLEVPSESDPEKSYIVVVDPFANRSELHVCNCNAFRYKGRCKHQRIAHLQLCGWNELDGPEKLEEDGVCPRCGQDAVQAIYEIKEKNE